MDKIEITSPRVFISHFSDDGDLSRKVFDWLTDQGLSAWLDRYELSAGMDLKETLLTNIQKADFVLLLITKPILSKWVQFEKEAAVTEEEKSLRMKLIPVVYGDIEVPNDINHRVYLRIDRLDKNSLEKIFSAIHHQYHILQIFLDKNFELDIPKTKESFNLYSRLKPKKQILIRVNNEGFTDRIIKYIKESIDSDNDISVDDKREMKIEADLKLFNLRNFWNILSLVISKVINNIVVDSNLNYSLIMKVLIKIFDYMIFYLYQFTTYVKCGNTHLHYSTTYAGYSKDKGISAYTGKFYSLEQQYPRFSQLSVYARYAFRDVENIEEWRRFYLTPKESYDSQYLSYYINNLYVYDKFPVSSVITETDWWCYCIPQIIYGYIDQVIGNNKRLEEYEFEIGTNMNNYDYISLP